MCLTIMYDAERPKAKDEKLSWNCSGSIRHLVWQTYCHGCVPIDLREPVPDPINPFVPLQPLLCLGSASWWEVNVRLNRDRDHTDVPFQSHTHICAHTHTKTFSKCRYSHRVSLSHTHTFRRSPVTSLLPLTSNTCLTLALIEIAKSGYATFSVSWLPRRSSQGCLGNILQNNEEEEVLLTVIPDSD